MAAEAILMKVSSSYSSAGQGRNFEIEALSEVSANFAAHSAREQNEINRGPKLEIMKSSLTHKHASIVEL